MNLLLKIQNLITQHNLIPESSTIIVGLSGGPDSVFLLHVLKELQSRYHWKLIAAHLNHGWRPEADSEQEFCRQLCEKLDILFVSKHAQDVTSTKKMSGSREELGRILRRTFFEEIAQKHHAQAIALAHHQDDQIETFFIRLIRGAGIEGLAGMSYKEGLYVRPLLDLYKKDILEYLHTHSITYCLDISNISDSFLRNRIRNQLIPVLNTVDSRFVSSCAKSIRQLQEVDEFIKKQAQTQYQKIATTDPELKTGLIIDQFLQLPSVLRHRILLIWLIEHHVPFTPSTSLFSEIERFVLNTKSSSHTLYTWQLFKKKQALFIKKNSV